jgi:hypothetical protein
MRRAVIGTIIVVIAVILMAYSCATAENVEDYSEPDNGQYEYEDETTELTHVVIQYETLPWTGGENG